MRDAYRRVTRPICRVVAARNFGPVGVTFVTLKSPALRLGFISGTLLSSRIQEGRSFFQIQNPNREKHHVFRKIRN
jgi:hypothetical protein